MTKKLLIPLLCAVTVLAGGCRFSLDFDGMDDYFVPTEDTSEQEQKEEPVVAFSDSTAQSVPGESIRRVDVEALREYQSDYAEYNSYTYFSGLTDQEKLVYRIFEYALDHGFPRIYIDQKLLDGNAYAPRDILRFLSLDSPMLEQNLVREFSDGNLELTDAKGRTRSVPVGRILVRNFVAENLELKKQAVEKAEQILTEAPENLSNTEKAQYIYDYLGTHVTYSSTDEREQNEIVYLYEALCVGTTNCDGFANAFSLLCNMSGIACCEKVYLPEEEKAAGHTWNAVWLDGLWYNVDGTGARMDVESECELRRIERIHFGFGDDLQHHEPMYEALAPNCVKSMVPVSCAFTSEKDAGLVKTIAQAYRKSERKYVIITLEEGMLSKQTKTKIANELGFGISVSNYSTDSGRNVYYIFYNGKG